MGKTGKFSSFVIIFWLFSVCYAQSIDSCSTPRNQSGECKSIIKCPSLLKILEMRPIESQDADYLKRSKCGLEGTITKVCCPIEYSDIESPLLPSTNVCGIDSPDRIIGGDVAGLRDFSWMCLVEYESGDKKRGFHCGGVLINSRYILTAAHCIKGKGLPKSWKLVSVRLGEHDTENKTDCVDKETHIQCAPPPQNIPVEETIVHEQYDPYDTNQYNDVGLLRLSRNVTYSAYIKPVCLPKTAIDQSKTFVGEQLMVAGWGRTDNNGSESSVKRKLYVPVVDFPECARIYSEAGVNLHEAQICAGGRKDKDSCKGDSGGPLMSLHANDVGDVNWYSIGIVSTGPSPCGKQGWPGVYARVANYLPWIVSKLRP